MIGEDPVPGGRRGRLFDLRCLDIHTECGTPNPHLPPSPAPRCIYYRFFFLPVFTCISFSKLRRGNKPWGSGETPEACVIGIIGSNLRPSS